MLEVESRGQTSNYKGNYIILEEKFSNNNSNITYISK